MWKKLGMFCLNLDLFLGESLSSTSHFLPEEINCVCSELRERTERARESARAQELSSPRDTESVMRPVETSGFWGDWAKTRCADPRVFQGVLSHTEFSKPDVTENFMHRSCFSDPFMKKGRDGTNFMWGLEPQLRAWARTCCHFTHGKKTTL